MSPLVNSPRNDTADLVVPVGVTMDAAEVIALFNRLADAVQSKIPLWLVMIEMTPEEVAALESLLTKCEERRVSCEELWRDGESEEQRILCELVKEVHRVR